MMIQVMQSQRQGIHFLNKISSTTSPSTATVSLLHLLFSTSSEQKLEDSEENFCQKRRVLEEKKEKEAGLVREGINSYVDFSDF